ncbi:MAG: hypothetical protein FWD87_02990 [Spirochaetaceae bacterium]|nr:hypothetical protein [Spirochaetaceae bacterium]
MKIKILGIGIVLAKLLLLSACLTTLPFLTQNAPEPIAYFELIEVPGLSKAEIFSRSKIYFNEAFGEQATQSSQAQGLRTMQGHEIRAKHGQEMQEMQARYTQEMQEMQARQATGAEVEWSEWQARYTQEMQEMQTRQAQELSEWQAMQRGHEGQRGTMQRGTMQRGQTSSSIQVSDQNAGIIKGKLVVDRTFGQELNRLNSIFTIEISDGNFRITFTEPTTQNMGFVSEQAKENAFQLHLIGFRAVPTFGLVTPLSDAEVRANWDREYNFSSSNPGPERPARSDNNFRQDWIRLTNDLRRSITAN